MSAYSISVYNSPVHGRGIRAIRPIAKREWIIEYRGKVMTEERANELHPHDPKQPNHTFIFTLGNGKVIDAWYGKCAAKWMNHSCDPNVEAEIVDTKVGRQVWLRALRDIRVGEELFFDYGLTLPPEDYEEAVANGDYECRCGAKNCRGTMLANPEDQ